MSKGGLGGGSPGAGMGGGMMKGGLGGGGGGMRIFGCWVAKIRKVPKILDSDSN